MKHWDEEYALWRIYGINGSLCGGKSIAACFDCGPSDCCSAGFEKLLLERAEGYHMCVQMDKHSRIAFFLEIPS